MDLGLIFLTGLTVGGLSCLAVQGGLLSATIAAREEEDTEEGDERSSSTSKRKFSVLPVLAFLTTKLVAYTVLGFILGSFGSALALSDSTRIVMQFLAGVYMIAIALNLLNVHPIFRYAIIQPPRFLTKLIRNTTRTKDIFAPSLLGALTVFVPCGTTLAMETFAISSGSPFLGAAILATFTLGTFPLFFGLGFATSFLGDTMKRKFFKLAGVLVLYLGITSFNGALVLAGSPITLQTIREIIPITIDLSGGTQNRYLVNTVGGIQVVDIFVYPNSYSPSYVSVRNNAPVRLNLTTTGGFGCTSQFRIPTLGISKNLLPDKQDFVEFTPNKTGKIVWTCSMGMYSGIIEVI